MSDAYWDDLEEKIALEASRGNQNTLDVTIHSTISAQRWSPFRSDGSNNKQDRRLLRSLWLTFFLAAKNYDQSGPKHDALLVLILTIRECGRIAAQTISAIAPDSTSRQTGVSGHALFEHLPHFVEDFYTFWFDCRTTMSIAERYRLSSFIAKLVCTGVCGNEFSAFALMDFRDALESVHQKEDEFSDLRLLACDWLNAAPDKLLFLSTTSFDAFTCFPHNIEVEGLLKPGNLAQKSGVTATGFSPARWQFWKQRLNDLAIEPDGPSPPATFRITPKSLLSPEKSAYEMMREYDGDNLDMDDS